MKIKELRTRLNLTQEEIGTLLGMSKHRVCQIENGLEGRSETKQMKAHLEALGLLRDFDVLMERCQKL